MNSNNTAKTERDPLDFYPTPLEVTGILRDWLAVHPGAPLPNAEFLDPAAGEGHIVNAMRDVWGESFWHAIEIDPERAEAAEEHAENVITGDALRVEWPAAHAILNPPFSLLDDFWKVASAHREKHGVWVAAFTPVAWWNAEKRSGYVRPDFLISLGWRPVFRRKMGAGHKGSQDFCWSILAPVPQPQTIWMREEKPKRAA